MLKLRSIKSYSELFFSFELFFFILIQLFIELRTWPFPPIAVKGR